MRSEEGTEERLHARGSKSQYFKRSIHLTKVAQTPRIMFTRRAVFGLSQILAHDASLSIASGAKRTSLMLPEKVPKRESKSREAQQRSNAEPVLLEAVCVQPTHRDCAEPHHLDTKRIALQQRRFSPVEDKPRRCSEKRQGPSQDDTAYLRRSKCHGILFFRTSMFCNNATGLAAIATAS